MELVRGEGANGKRRQRTPNAQCHRCKHFAKAHGIRVPCRGRVWDETREAWAACDCRSTPMDVREHALGRSLEQFRGLVIGIQVTSGKDGSAVPGLVLEFEVPVERLGDVKRIVEDAGKGLQALAMPPRLHSAGAVRGDDGSHSKWGNVKRETLSDLLASL